MGTEWVYLTKATEGFVFAAQEQAVRTRWARSTIDGATVSAADAREDRARIFKFAKNLKKGAHLS